MDVKDYGKIGGFLYRKVWSFLLVIVLYGYLNFVWLILKSRLFVYGKLIIRN